MDRTPYSITASELALLGSGSIPEELKSVKHLIYSSPATLAFNSPGAEGFGVKRAGLAIPGSVMLLVAPGCCGRNTTMQSRISGYEDRFYYLLQDDTDIVTGRHLNRISQAVKEIVESRSEKPTAVMICITCVDALLGTDMDRVCRKATAASGVPVLPCYMYALERESRMPPMTAVRKTVYALLSEKKRKGNAVNLLGEFAPFADSSELYDLLRGIGMKKIRQISTCRTFEEYLDMAEANFNLVLNPQSVHAAADLSKRLGIPYIQLTRLYRPEKIHRQYELFGSAIGVTVDDREYFNKAVARLEAFKETHQDLRVAIGECLNADAFELALSFASFGCTVTEVYGTVTVENFPFIKALAKVSPDTKIFTNLSPTMIHYASSEVPADVTIGRDAQYYQPLAPNVPWNQEIQPFGYDGLIRLLDEVEECLKKKGEAR